MNVLTDVHDPGQVNKVTALPHSNQPHIFGILAKTVFDSPIINFILPAQIRDQWRNDVVFIGDHYIRLREILEDGHFRDVASKSNFGARICAARVIGERQTSTECSEEAVNVKKEEEATPVSAAGDRFPPQVLVLTLQSSELVFLVAKRNCNGEMNFTTVSTPLPRPKLLSEGPGKHIGIDPRSRAIAVTASSGILVLYNIRSRNEPNTTLQTLICNTITVNAKMVILKMDFVYPSKEDDDRVYLVIIGSKGGDLLHLNVYSWDSSVPLQPGVVDVKVVRLGKGKFVTISTSCSFSDVCLEHGMPTMLVPLMQRYAGSFMLVCERGFSIYRDVHVMAPQRTWFRTHVTDRNDGNEAPRFPGSSCRSPRWVNWARPLRISTWQEDNIYFGREDGLVRYVSMGAQPGTLAVYKEGSAIRLVGNIDTAFACLDIFRDGLLGSGTDALLIGGSLSDGGFYELNSTLGLGFQKLSRIDIMAPKEREIFYNWAPFTDLAVVSDPRLSNGPVIHSKPGKIPSKHIYATSGKALSGALSELRYGLEVRLHTSAAFGDSAWVNGMWPLQSTSMKASILLVSFPTHSDAFILDPNFITALSWDCNEPTLAVEILASTYSVAPHQPSIVVQITSDHVQLLHLSSETPFLKTGPSWRITGIMSAAIEPRNSLVLIATREKFDCTLRLRRLVDVDCIYKLVEVGDAIFLNSEPTCVAFFRLMSKSSSSNSTQVIAKLSRTTSMTTYAVVGTAAGMLQIFKVDLEAGLVLIANHELPAVASQGLTASCESIIFLEPPEFGNQATPGKTLPILLCGLRDGSIHAVELEPEDNSASFAFGHSVTIPIGNTSVQVTADINKPSNAFLCCGLSACYLEYSAGRLGQMRISSTWFFNPDDRSFAQSSILAFCQIPSGLLPSQLGGHLACVTDSNLLIGSLDDFVKPLPRQLAIPGTPSRMLYSDHLKMLIVGSTETEVDELSNQRLSYFSLFLVSPDGRSPDSAQDGDQSEYPAVEAEYLGAPGERLCGMMEWFCSIAETEHHLIVITITRKDEHDQQVGSIRYFRVSRNDLGHLTISEARDESTEDHPIMAICAFRKDSFVYCCGNELRMRTYQPGGSFRKKKLFRMKSQGVYITAEDPFIYVTTASSSLTIFRYENDELLPFTSDDRARKGIAHLSMPNHKLVLVTDRDGSVTGIRQPERRPILNSTSACFEAELPCSITRLCKAAIRPPWKQSTVPGIVERDLLGSAADGSLFAFSVITETSWRLLRFVQNMCQRDARLSYLTGPTTNTRTHLEPDGTKPTGYHVDGDILSRLVDRHDDYEVLTSMLAADPADDPNNGGCVDFDTADERQMRFAQLVSEAMEGHPDKSGNGVEAARWSFSAVNRDPVEVALKYIRAAVDTPF